MVFSSEVPFSYASGPFGDSCHGARLYGHIGRNQTSSLQTVLQIEEMDAKNLDKIEANVTDDFESIVQVGTLPAGSFTTYIRST